MEISKTEGEGSKTEIKNESVTGGMTDSNLYSEEYMRKKMSACETKSVMETGGTECGSEDIGSGLLGSSSVRFPNHYKREEMDGDPVSCNAQSDPITCWEAEESSAVSGCSLSNTVLQPTASGTSYVLRETPQYSKRKMDMGEMCHAWPTDGYEEPEDDDHQCGYTEPYEQLPDIACLGISTVDSVEESPSKDSSTKEFIMMCDYQATDDTQLSLFYGDRVVLLSSVTQDWWWVEHNGSQGYVPSSHLHRIDDEDDVEEDDPWQDEEYYGSYKTLRLHLEMLSDSPRTQTYRDVILHNSSALKGKRILDLGCGTGIISFFCAQLAEPEVVYAVEASDIAEQTSKLAEENGFSGTVKVLCQRAEELELPTKVDVLVSEWMGTCLVFEFMLESVLLVRDRWLNEGGVMWPSTASVHLVPCSAEKEYASKVLFWESPYGLDFSVLKPMAVHEFLSKPKPDYVLNPEDCLSAPCTLLNIDMKTLTVEELERMSGSFVFHVERDGVFHGFTAWFSVQFENIEEQGHVELNTGPFNPATHWKHTLFMLDEPLQVHKGDKIQGSTVFLRNPCWRRHLSVRLGWTVTKESAPAAHSVGCKIFPIWR
ncbi:protein arginine N-methyltransferase 2 [Hyperolius riggenbachi]|uniref:protein arginine N-methyltransferase 2 n=1 Tax=Hyperolius riggenbachi TaxID=752182 RepID=UPI0035A29CA3